MRGGVSITAASRAYSTRGLPRGDRGDPRIAPRVRRSLERFKGRAQEVSRVAPHTELMEPASNVYEAAIVEREKSHSRIKIVPTIDDELRPDLPVVKDLVIRRKSDGKIIVRTPADLGSPEAMLKTVQGDLRRMSADEFFEEWKMPSL